jgi:chlorite dismutase
MTSILWNFTAGLNGQWRIVEIDPIMGEGLGFAERLNVTEQSPKESDFSWRLSGVTSNLRYTSREERDSLTAKQAPLGRTVAKRAALIPIKKSAAWWALAQDERRTIIEERSHHIQIGLDYLPQIARRLHHCRELGEPFDFLTWFDFTPEHEPLFNDLLARLRASEEWRYVEREVDIRLVRTEIS